MRGCGHMKVGSPSEALTPEEGPDVAQAASAGSAASTARAVADCVAVRAMAGSLAIAPRRGNGGGR